MSALPQGWSQATIGEVTERFISIDPTRQPGTSFRYIDIGCIDNSRQLIRETKYFLSNGAPSRARRLVKSGDVLFSTVRTYLRNIALVPEHLDGALTSTGIALLRPPEIIDSKYLFRWVCSETFVASMSKAQDGTMYPAITDQDVANGQIALPPLPEQRRIVAKLDSLFAHSKAARDELARIPLLIEHYKQAILEKAFRGELTADWRRATLGDSCKVDWHLMTIGEVATVASGQTPKGIEAALSSDGDIPWFKVSSMNDERNHERMIESDFRLKQQSAKTLGLRLYPPGAIIFPKRGGAIATNKKRCLATFAALDLNLMCLVPTHVEPEFLWW